MRVRSRGKDMIWEQLLLPDSTVLVKVEMTNWPDRDESAGSLAPQ